ncbi:hypothetical protein EYZ11_010339 [Aspergillus tanneri]|uniref:Wax synthase domain-containing protein n=1 Tax=Aspergillus tanneri TaxID=1220188 RepID=A0A4S3J5W8_9EURO|nr:uncharacterized protein ATNIH1004_001537 [Aspergillus tanneri]KAA8652632.1 hypothetical protein ATNIH1004_001537 [Aspergillus tanneri]THC90195.1 hypothetical protein EYZ11_010339 [Aspergillus tanneri]
MPIPERNLISGGVYIGTVYLIQNLVPALLILYTKKRSLLRYLWAPCSTWIFYQYLLLPVTHASSAGYYTKAGSQIAAGVLQSLNLLIIDAQDRDDLLQKRVIQPSANGFKTVFRTARLFMCLRGIGTPWQARDLPPQPAFLTRRGSPRYLFLIRQAAFALWYYLVFNVLTFLSLQAASQGRSLLKEPSFNLDYFTVSINQWLGRVMVSWMTCFVSIPLSLDFDYRVLSIVFVMLGIDSPDDWPPLFGSVWDAYTVRNIWSKYLHQIFRWPFTSLSRFLTREVLDLPKRSALERYTNVLFVFTLSGLVHFGTDLVMGIPANKSFSMFYFPSFALGIMIEDLFQQAWHAMTTSENANAPKSSSGATRRRETPCWQKVASFLWTTVWISILTPMWIYPMQAFTAESMFLIYVPRLVGMPAALALIVAGGVGLKCVFGGEE